MKDVAAPNWIEVSLAEVCLKIQDGAHHSPKTTFQNREPGTYPYVTSKNIRHWELDRENIVYVGEDFHQTIYPRCNAEYGDVLLTKDGANTGQVTINTFDEPISLLSSVCLLKPDPTKIDARYLVYFIQSDEGFERITGQMTGAAIKRIILKKIKASPIPLPPLEDQRRIVAVLDEAFAGLARARANAEANLADARGMFEGSLISAFGHLSEAYGETELGEVADFRNGFAFKSAKFKPSGAPVVRISNIQSGEVTQEKLVYTDPNDYSEDLSRYWVEPGDLLIAMSGATTGKVGFNKTGERILQNQRVGRFRSSQDINLSFLYFFLSTKVAEHLSISAGSAQPNLSTKQIKEIRFPAVSKLQQDQWALRFEKMREKVECVEKKYQDQLKNFDDLRQSLLQKAFSGAL